jgi:uncharacterized protein YkwD
MPVRRPCARAITVLVALLAFVALAAAPADARHGKSRKAAAHESYHRLARYGLNRHRRTAPRRRPAVKPAPSRPVTKVPGPVTTPGHQSNPSTTCTGADAVPDAAGVATAATATLCLVNRERAGAGLAALVASPQLASAATAHSADMVHAHYFSHDSLDGRTMVYRIRAAGWATSGSWRAGENIAWGSGSYGTPRRIVENWMNSPGHRANILNGGFREAGSGVAAGAPQATSMAAAMYTMDFGAHS